MDFLDILNQEFLWPKKGDRLLREDENNVWNKAVQFEEDKTDRHVFLWSGYMRAGAILIEQCQEQEEPLDRLQLIYPILYCYRHAFELAMKWVITHYGRYVDEQISDYQDHNMLDLWAACRKIILEVGSDGEDEALDVVGKIAKEFHDLDKGSSSFRYASDKNNKVIKLPKKAAIDLDNIRKTMKKVNNFFEGVDGQLNNNASAVEDY